MRTLLALLSLLATGTMESQPTPTAVASPVQAQRPPLERRMAARAASRYDATFRRYSKRFFSAAFDWHWFKAQGMAESNLDSTATSWVGARGIMQLMPATYAEIRSRQPAFGPIDDPEWNIAAGIYYNRQLWRRWTPRIPDEARLPFVFGSYNAGEGTIARAAATARRADAEVPTWDAIEQVAPRVPRWRYRETLGYVRKIQEHHAQLTTR